MSQQAECPICNKRGGLVIRRDAYVNLAIPADGNVDWTDTSDVTTYDHSVYECTDCGKEVELSDIEAHNNITIE